ncbi:MAG: hypothetical protein Q4A32_11035 [Lachnospiraceae bacterium]|nr:hypothetical protein [Lachnospiraceae bacterium]
MSAGTAEGGTMQYALGTETEATEQYTTSIPTATDAGTYYVWYKVVGDENHTDTEAVCVTATITPEEAHQHTFDIGDPRWAWSFVDGNCYANATYTCTCGETQEVSATVEGIESDDHTTITYTATDEYDNTDTRTYDASYIVTYKGNADTCKYGDTWRKSEDSAYDWMVNDVLRASGTKEFFFPVIGNAAVTTTASSLEEQNALINVLSAEGGADKLTYVVSWSLPKGAKVKSTMIYRCRDDKAAITTADDLKAASNLRTYNMKMKVRNGQYTFTASGLTSGSSQTIIAEVVYTYNSETYTINTASGTEGPMHIGIGNA